MKLDRFLYSQALAAARNSDYAHPGEEESIDLLLNFFPEDKNVKILDFGCGLGGTLNYISQKGYKNLVGYDQDKSSINYCIEKYGESGAFIEVLDEYCGYSGFDLTYLINVMYLIEDKIGLLTKLEQFSKESTQLLISDFFAPGEVSLKVKEYLPFIINRREIEKINEISMWKVVRCQDITSNYLIWYNQFVERIKRNEDSIKSIAGVEYYQYMLTKYSYLVNKIIKKEIGGNIIVFKR